MEVKQLSCSPFDSFRSRLISYNLSINNTVQKRKQQYSIINRKAIESDLCCFFFVCLFLFPVRRRNRKKGTRKAVNEFRREFVRTNSHEKKKETPKTEEKDREHWHSLVSFFVGVVIRLYSGELLLAYRRSSLPTVFRFQVGYVLHVSNSGMASGLHWFVG